MNRSVLMARAAQMVGNDVMNPGQPQRWMEKPAGDTSPLALLRPLDSLLAKQIVSFTESMYDFDRQSRKKSAFFFQYLQDCQHKLNMVSLMTWANRFSMHLKVNN